MSGILLVFVGAGLGGVLRHLVNLTSASLFGAGFPWGTLAVNVAGSLAMGLAAGLLAGKAEAAWAQPAKLLLATGVLGGFTTFSAFSLEVVALWERGAAAQAAGYAGASVALSVAALYAGLSLVRMWT